MKGNEAGYRGLLHWAMMNKVRSHSAFDLECLICGWRIVLDKWPGAMEDHVKKHIERDDITLADIQETTLRKATHE